MKYAYGDKCMSYYHFIPVYYIYFCLGLGSPKNEMSINCWNNNIKLQPGTLKVENNNTDIHTYIHNIIYGT